MKGTLISKALPTWTMTGDFKSTRYYWYFEVNNRRQYAKYYHYFSKRVFRFEPLD